MEGSKDRALAMIAKCAFAIAPALLLAAATTWASNSSATKMPSTNTATKGIVQAAGESAALEQKIDQLREALASQAKQIDEQTASLKAQQEQLSRLEKQLESLRAGDRTPASQSTDSASAGAVPTVARLGQPASTRPEVIPAITPIRTLPVGGLTREALKPAFTIDSVRVAPYGFIKATFVHDSSSPNGDDFPLPGFLGDSGPTASPEFHIKARSSRLGTNFEWLDRSSKLTLTGKIEVDFEGNFSRSDNRNLSSIRSSMPSIRLAYGRLDYKVGPRDTVSALFGQDWTPFGSSTLPNILETTGLGIGFGVLWERDPQMRFGWTHDFGKFQLMPEFALVLPGSGEAPAAAELVDQLGYGERQGADSDRPSLQARIVLQWQLDHAPGVAPAQIIFSGETGRREAIVLGSAVPSSFQAAFPRGATVSSNTDGWSGEWQLPTRYATLIGKYYSGSDLRWFFAGQLFSNFNDTSGLTGVATATSIDGASTVAFGLRDGVPVVAPQRPVRAAGGFVSLGIPISRLLGADPHGRNAGWSIYLTYGTDEAKTRDLLKVAPAGSRARSDMSVGTLYYKLNNRVTFAFEQSLYRTRANTEASRLPLFMGEPQHEWKDLRSEGGTIFSF
jgi:uncharacterized coiled-coil protein SlyX